MFIDEREKGFLKAVAKTAISKGLKPWKEVLGEDVDFEFANGDEMFEILKDLRKKGLYIDCSSYRDNQNWVRVTKKGYELIKNELQV
ncbi:hypothetical protein PQ692_00230 [Thermoanaerobacterium thermosaccharolyticum]|uniref:hypothetical protein n=1 Tax=Thermoanaerobacterium thermosaccharolyticum TaxID=1517 RepID=UPI003DA9310F